MSLSPERAQFIADIANDEWIDRLTPSERESKFEDLCAVWDARLIEFLSSAADPEELHYFAASWNWDAGTVEPLWPVVRNPACQRATALLLFWSAQPEDYRRYGSVDEVPESGKEIYKLVKHIEQEFLADRFAGGAVAYAPSKHWGFQDPSPSDKWAIPEVMYQAVELRTT